MRLHVVAILATLACGGAVRWEPDPVALAQMSPEDKAAADSLASAEAAWRTAEQVLEDHIGQKETAIRATASDAQLAEEMTDESRAALKAGDRGAAKDIELLAAQRSELTARRRFLEEEIDWLAARRDLCTLRADSCQKALLSLQARATGARAGILEVLRGETEKCCRAIESQLRHVQQLERVKESQRKAWEVLEELWKQKRDERVRRR